MNLGAVDLLNVFKTSDALPGKDADYDVQLEKQASHCTQEIVDKFIVSKSPHESRSLLQTLFMPTKPQVFVIMKFNDKALDSAYETAIKPIIRKFKYKALRINEVQDSGRISDQILGEIMQSQIVLADLTGERPNCYYEAGFAHAIGKEIVFTIQRGTNIHFDLAGHRFIEWETDNELKNELDKRFKAIRERLSSYKMKKHELGVTFK
jgi:hypothetical protein